MALEVEEDNERMGNSELRIGLAALSTSCQILEFNYKSYTQNKQLVIAPKKMAPNCPQCHNTKFSFL